MTYSPFPHQYIDRPSGGVTTEKLIGDRTVTFLYNTVREQAPAMFRALTCARMSSLLGSLHFDRPVLMRRMNGDLLRRLGIDPDECLEPATYYSTYRRVFERQIAYWQCRPMPPDRAAILAPADARILIGSLARTSSLFIKEKFFSLAELLGDRRHHCARFERGDFAVFRLTPDKYHYNHLPVSGTVTDVYLAEGAYHSCNPAATITMASVYSKNRRIITLIDTDVPGGTGVGLVAMIEIVALMIGDIVQCYSERRYEQPRPLSPGLFCHRGAPKSLFRPGSSTVVLLFEPDRVEFSADLRRNSERRDVNSRFSITFGRPLVETDVRVRSEIGTGKNQNHGE